MRNRFLLLAGAALLIAVMVLGSANTDAAGDGDVISIDSQEDLARIGTGVVFEGQRWSMDASYVQTSDIVLTKDHVPIGTVGDPFTGDYDGGGHSIMGLRTRDAESAGLFGTMWSSASVMDVRLIDAWVRSDGAAGGIAGAVAGSSRTNMASISGCTVSGSIVGDTVGGIAGYAGNAVITECGSSTTVTGTVCGGIAGSAGTGVLIGISYNDGNISAGTTAGGIVGKGAAAEIADCYNQGTLTVSGTGSAGGAVGSLTGYLEDTWNHGSVKNTYNTGTVLCKGSSGGIVGRTDGQPDVISSYYTASRAYTTAFGTETDARRLMDTMNAGWDYDGVWQMVPNAYPTLRAFNSPVDIGTVDDVTAEHLSDVRIAFSVEPADAAVTVEGASWLSVSDGFLTGKAPASAGRYDITLIAECPGYDAGTTAFRIDVVVTEYAIGITKEGSGTVHGDMKVVHGEDGTIRFAPDRGYTVAEVIVDGVSDPDAVRSGKVVFSNVVGNRTVHVVFDRMEYDIVPSCTGGGSVFPSETVGVRYMDAVTFTFVPETGFIVSKVVIDGMEDKGAAVNRRYSFSGVDGGHTLSVEFSRIRYMIDVTSTDGGSVSPGTVSADHGSDVSFVFTPDAGYRVSSVIADGDISEKSVSDLGHVFGDITEDHTLKVIFERIVLSIDVSTEGGGTADGGRNVMYGDDARFVFIPDIGYRVSSVIADGEDVEADRQFVFKNVIGGHTLKVVFERIVYRMDISVEGDGAVTGPRDAPHGSDVSLTFVPGEGGRVAAVTVDGENAGECGSYVFEDIDRGHSVHVRFVLMTFTVKVSSDDGGTITPNGNIHAEWGSGVQLTVRPDAGYEVSAITIDGHEADVSNTIILDDVREDHTVTAEFARITYMVHASVEGGEGNVSPDGDVRVEHGDDLELVFTPDPGYYVDKIVVDGADVPADGTYMLRNVIKEHRIGVVFRITVYDVILSAGGGGRIERTDTAAEHGSDVCLTFVPDEGKKIGSVVVDGAEVGAGISYSFPEIDRDHSVHVEFIPLLFSITVNVGDNGTSSYDGGAVEYGGTGTMMFVPADGYGIKKITINGMDVTDTFKDGKVVLRNVKTDIEVSVTFDDVREDMSMWVYVIIAACAAAALLLGYATLVKRRNGRRPRKRR